MSAKRPAQYQIDQKTLQDKPAQAQSHHQNGSNHTTEQLKQRNILNIKKDQETNDKSKQSAFPKKQQNKPAGNSLFTGLFANSTSNGSGLFSTSKPTGGLFGNGPTKQTQAPSLSGLFSKNTTDDNKPKTGGLFSNSSSTSGSIFNFQNTGVPPIKNTGSSLFPNKSNEQIEDSGDSAELEAAQNLEGDPSKSTVNFKYEQTCKLILKLKAFKFKKQGGDLIQNVQVIVKQDNGSQMFYLSIVLPATKKSIFTGIIVQNKSQVRHLNNKKQNVQVSAFSVVKGKLQQSILKCQFQKQEYGQKLYSTILEIINGSFTYKAPQVQQKQTAQNGERQQKKEKAKQQKQSAKCPPTQSQQSSKKQ